LKLLLAFLVLLPACASTPAEPPDARVAVVWNRVDDPHKVCESLSGRKHFFNVLGCSQWSEPAAAGGARICSIYAPEPRSERDVQRFATLGHELMHCFDGNWHDKWGRMNAPNRNIAGVDSPSAASGGSVSAQR
jgi:hypothetical protein